MRGLHVRGLHGVWGIALGYEISFPDDKRKSLQVTQGLAYDCGGHEIIMPASLTVDLPPAPHGSGAKSWWFDLLIRYDNNIPPSRYSTFEACGGLSRIQEQPVFRWSYAGNGPEPIAPGFADDVRLGEEIPIARVEVLSSGAFGELDLAVRRVARGLVRPHVAEGRVEQGSVGIDGSLLHWTARIDTLSGGFTTLSPFYFVSLGDHPWLAPNSGFSDTANTLTPEQRGRLLGPFTSIVAPFKTGFTLEVRAATSVDIVDTLRGAAQQGLRLPVDVNWLGIERNAGCRPPIQSLYKFFLSRDALLRVG
jgi:hypothetical protein